MLMFVKFMTSRRRPSTTQHLCHENRGFRLYPTRRRVPTDSSQTCLQAAARCFTQKKKTLHHSHTGPLCQSPQVETPHPRLFRVPGSLFSITCVFLTYEEQHDVCSVIKKLGKDVFSDTRSYDVLKIGDEDKFTGTQSGSDRKTSLNSFSAASSMH